MDIFPDQTRHAAIGDSITHNGWYLPYIHLYYLTRFPGQRLDVFNCGINGDTAQGGVGRYAWDIAPHRPTTASIMFGMNDVGREAYEMGKAGPEIEKLRLASIDSYEKNLRTLVGILQKDKTRVSVILPSIFDDTASTPAPHYPGLNEGLGEIARRARNVAAEMNCAVVDFYGEMLKITLARQAMEPAFSMIDIDRTHPTVRGDLFMAYVFLKAQQVPAEVACLSIRASDGIVAKAENCQVDEIQIGNNQLSFRYAANALPFPIEPSVAGVTTWVPLIDELNREMLQVIDLPAGRYRILIDGLEICTRTAAELAHGVNLALETGTPQARQAQAVWAAYKERQALVFKLRTIACVERAAFAPHPPRPGATLVEMEPLLEAFLKSIIGSPWEKAIFEEVATYRLCKPLELGLPSQIDAMLEDIRVLAQPKPHVVKLSLVQ